MNTNWSNRVDWNIDDGVLLPMLNDFSRNQFYDRVLQKYVKDQMCVDIGFGTGLLSMIALKHGAKHITAFEQDLDRYCLGHAIISRLHLGKRIELIHKKVDQNFNYSGAVVYAEIVDSHLWGEGLYNILPSDPDQLFLPGTYFLEMWAVKVSLSLAQGLCRAAHEKVLFNPGIDIDTNFVRLLNELVGTPWHESDLPQGIVHFAHRHDQDYKSCIKLIQNGSIVAKYHIDRRQDGIDYIELNIDTSEWSNSVVLLGPRTGMSQDNDRLYLDTGHWTLYDTLRPVLLVYPTRDVRIRHNLHTGTLEYLSN